jgi:hypothetical protein
MENVISSQPLYERIIVDRANMSMQGFTFEKPSDTKYSEHYIYQQSIDNKINYDMFLFRDPGLKRVIRHKAH